MAGGFTGLIGFQGWTSPKDEHLHHELKTPSTLFPMLLARELQLPLVFASHFLCYCLLSDYPAYLVGVTASHAPIHLCLRVRIKGRL